MKQVNILLKSNGELKRIITDNKLYRNVPVFRDNLLNDLVIEFAQIVKLKVTTDDVHMKQDTKLKCIA